jgi:hypothetical protein
LVVAARQLGVEGKLIKGAFAAGATSKVLPCHSTTNDVKPATESYVRKPDVGSIEPPLSVKLMSYVIGPAKTGTDDAPLSSAEATAKFVNFILRTSQ